MIGAILGSAIGIGSSIYGGIKASQAAKKANQIEQANYDKQMRDNQNWYDRRYNEDGTQRADAQRILTMTQDNLRRANRAAQGRNAVTGASMEEIAAQKQASADAMADATSKIAVANEARKDDIENNYMARQNALNDAHTKYGVELENQRAKNIQTAAQGVASAAIALGGSIDDINKTTTMGGGSTTDEYGNLIKY